MKKITIKDAQVQWDAVRATLKKVGSDLVMTGWHEGGYYYVRVAAEESIMELCVKVLKTLKYKGTTGRVREFKVIRGDLGGIRKATHVSTEGYLKVNGELV